MKRVFLAGVECAGICQMKTTGHGMYALLSYRRVPVMEYSLWCLRNWTWATSCRVIPGVDQHRRGPRWMPSVSVSLNECQVTHLGACKSVFNGPILNRIALAEVSIMITMWNHVSTPLFGSRKERSTTFSLSETLTGFKTTIMNLRHRKKLSENAR